MKRSEKIFVADSGKATICCADCGITKQVPVQRYRGKKHTLKIRCSCGSSFPVHLEFRKAYRKSTELDGVYRIISNGGGGGAASIQNISKDGIGFSVSGVHAIKVGQKAMINFVLDNRKSTRINKEVVVRSVTKNRIGCQFSDHQPFEKDLGFYLQP
ncbi:MAG: hypothetical protein D6B25_13110 [Desulfobulbaceae bacterium]|nr:MAG: hypothetical protein D6B25_13110 [Desulfobulbaceae bacterium]